VTLTISMPALLLIGFSLALFIGVTILCHQQGMLDGPGSGGYLGGIDALFTIILYAIMKLASVTGVMMANAEGADIAFDRLLGTAQFVLKTMPKQPAKLVKVH